MIEIPNDLISSEAFVTTILGHSLTTSDIIDYSNTAILSPRNENIAKINEKVLSLLQGNRTTYRTAVLTQQYVKILQK